MGDTETSDKPGASVRGKGWVTFDDNTDTASTVSGRLSHSGSDTPGSLEVRHC